MQSFGLPGGERLNGAAASATTLYTWGDSLRAWDLASGKSRLLAGSGGAPFARAGCLYDGGFVLQQGDRLVWLAGRRKRELAREIETPDILGVTLFGRRGVLIIQKHAQVRFYELPSSESRDIYSVYTPSRQAGLILHEVDGDGRPDFFCGNYWVRAPERFDLPWRLFAINTWTETPDSGMVRLALLGVRVVACQAEMPRARLSVFERPPDPRELWREAALSSDLRYPRGLAVIDGEIAVAEDAGPGSRVLLYAETPRVLATGGGLHTLVACGAALVGIGVDSVTIWGREDRRRHPSASPHAPGRTGP
ncbi:MAG TPA: hypothetical protein VN428_08775 [Bryobacteraceae bacterium]|nr:hypothetical protein [Bryobacteraceae bacterium]